MQYNGCNAVIDAILIQSCSTSCVHMAVTLLSTALGNARYADLVTTSTANQQAQNGQGLGNSPHHSAGFTRGRAGSNSSVGSSHLRNTKPVDTSSELSVPTGTGANYHIPTFAHLDGADLYQGDNGDSAWGLFAEMIR